MRFTIAILSSILILLSACKKDEEPIDDIQYGKNRFTTQVDGDEREYYVHVPASYNSNEPVPVVFMLHGSSGDGERFYNISGWKKVGEKENILTVYPSSWSYCIIDDGKRKNTTKWNIYPASWTYCANETPRDDIKFLRQVIDELDQRYNVDGKRRYLAGFSNGGAMAFRCAVEMSDIFAAIVESAGTYSGDSTFTPLRKIPLTFQVGNSDTRWFNTPFPLVAFDSLLTNSPRMQKLINAHIRTFDFETNHTTTGDPNKALTATYKGIPDVDNRQFNYTLIYDLGHNYPNGKNHPLNGAELNWEWMKQYVSP